MWRYPLGSGGNRVTMRPPQRPLALSSWMAVRMKFGGGGADSGVDMMLCSPASATTSYRGQEKLGSPAAPGPAWVQTARRHLRDRRTSMLSGGIAMRTKYWHRLCLTILATLVAGA